MPESHSRDSLSTVVHKKVNNTRVEHFHIERLLPTDTLNLSPFKGVGGSLPRGVVILDSIYVEKFTDIEVHDTITVTQIDTVSIAVPCPSWGKGAGRRERGYIPRVYKNCTIGFFLLLLAILAYIAIRFYLHR